MVFFANGRIKFQSVKTRLRICSFAQAVRRLSRIFTALFASFPALACQNTEFLQSSGHLELGVRFSTHDPRIIQQSSRALKRWSEIADMAWHREDSDSCSINIEDDKFTDEEEIAEANAEAGSITFGSADKLTAKELFITAFHEIGHLLGLQHNPRRESVMYWVDIRGDEVLDEFDMRTLAARHALRGGSRCSESAGCEVSSGPLEQGERANEMHTSHAALASGVDRNLRTFVGFPKARNEEFKTAKSGSTLQTAPAECNSFSAAATIYVSSVSLISASPPRHCHD